MKEKKALVISGGGSWGAWGGGVIEALVKCSGRDYDLVVGSSTGSILSSLSSIGDVDRLKDAYTSVTQEDIFDVNPFNKDGSINMFNAVKRIVLLNPLMKIFGKDIVTLGESNQLRNTIKRFFSEKDFDKLKSSGKEVSIAVVNNNTEKAEMKSSKDGDYEDLVDWIWASACAPVFMTLVKKNGNEYVDGGIVEHIPIQDAIDKGATDIDVIVHRQSEYKEYPEYKSKNILDLFMKVIDVMHKEISKNDISISKLRAKDEDVVINFYYTPKQLSENSLIFDKETMTEWWEKGFKEVKDESFEKKTVFLKRK